MRSVEQLASSAHLSSKYRIKVTIPPQAGANGATMGIHFVRTEPTIKNHGTGIAQFSKSKAGKRQFTKHYHRPEFKGRNVGTRPASRNKITATHAGDHGTRTSETS